MAMEKQFNIIAVSRGDIVHQWRKEGGVKLDESCVKKITDKDMKQIASDMGDAIGEGASFWWAIHDTTEEIIKKCRI